MALAPRRPDGSQPNQKPGQKSGPQPKAPAAPPRKVDIPGEEGASPPAAAAAPTAPTPKRPPTGENKGPAPRRDAMISMEPPRRGPKLAPGARMDAIGVRMNKGPTFSHTRLIKGKDDKQDLFGRKKTEELAKRQAMEPPPKPQSSEGYDPAAHMARKKHTVRVPKPGGGVMGADNAALDRMNESGRRPAVASSGGQPMPPVSSLAKGNVAAKKPDAPPPPPSVRTSTLAGVSAEELLGEEGKALMEQVKRREAARPHDTDTRKVRQAGLYSGSQAPVAPVAPVPRVPVAPIPVAPVPPVPMGPVSPIPVSPIPVQPQAYVPPAAPARPAQPSADLAPRAQDSSRMAFSQAGDDTPPSDDLGYEKPVDFGGDAASGVATESGEVVYEEEEVSDADLQDEAGEARESAAHEEMEQKVGYLLWLQGVITVEEVEDAIRAADPREARQEIMDLLNNSGFTGQQSLYRFLARHESLAPVDLHTTTPSDAALATLRPAVARAYRVVPVAVLGKILLVAAAMPFDPERLLELRSLTGRKVKVFVTSPEDIDAALRRYYPGGPRGKSDRQPAVDTSTGEVPKPVASGDKLAAGYDPTVSGEDSGLYVAQSQAPAEPEGVAMESAEEAPGQAVVERAGGGPESTAVERGSEVAESGDLDESALSGGADPLGDDNELKLGEDAASSAEQGGKEKDKPRIETGPEDLDPFGD